MVWVYGDPAARLQPFEPHHALDGATFSTWSDPVLVNASPWPSVSHFYPGDHGGCLCSWAPVLEEQGD
jgi:hypothetical protein